MTARADTVDNINKFIRKLCNVDIFNSVDYTGYSYVDSEAMWDIHVSCTLAESAGRHTDTDAQAESEPVQDAQAETESVQDAGADVQAETEPVQDAGVDVNE